MTREDPMLPFRTEQLLSQQAWLRSLAATLVRDQAARDDLVQEAWLAALRHPQAGERRDLRQWLGAVLRNRWRFERRSDARRRAREQGRTEREPVPASADLVEQAELQGVLVRAVLALEEPYRSTVLQRYFGELTCRAIARQEGVPEGTVRSRLKRALDQLRDELDRQTGGERRAWILALVPLARLARGRHALTLVAAVAAMAIIALVVGWSWIWGGERVSPELAAATTDSAPHVGLVPATQEAMLRAPLAGETADADDSSALVASAHLELLVLAPENQPIANATVVCGADERKHTLHTDERGTCRIPDDSWSDDGSALELEIDAPGFVRQVDQPIGRGSFSWSSPLPITLPRAVTLEGSLRDADTGQAIEDGELTLLFPYHGPPLAKATSGDDGSFQLEPAPRGWEVELLIRAPGHAPLTKLVQVSSSSRAYLEIALPSGVELHGQLVDAWSGSPLKDVHVFHDVNGFEGVPNESARELACSDANGQITLRTRIEENRHDLLFTRTGYCSLRVNPKSDAFELPLIPIGTVVATVRDGEGSPMVGSEVVLGARARNPTLSELDLERCPGSNLSALPEDASIFVPVWNTQTNDQGQFQMQVVPGFERCQLSIRGPQHSNESWTLDSPLAPGETRHVEIRVASAGTIEGLLRINGQPSPGRVRCLGRDKNVSIAWTQPDGRFEIRGVPLGRVSIQAFPDECESRGYSPNPRGRTDGVLAEVEVVTGEKQSIDLDLVLPMGTIRGRVTSPSGEPLAHASVLASASSGSGYWRTVTVADGSFLLQVPAESSTYELRVQDGPPVTASVDAEGIELVSVAYGHIRLLVEDVESHAVIERVTLFSRRAKPEWQSAGEFSPGTNGYAQWDLEAGVLELAVGMPDEGYPTISLGRFTLAEDADLELEAVLERVTPTEFVLTNPPLPGVCGIRIESMSGLPMEGSMFGGGSMLFLSLRDGRASVPGLGSGDYRISASFPDVVVQPSEIRLGADRSRPIELTWHRKE